MIQEHERTIAEAERNAAEREYFGARQDWLNATHSANRQLFLRMFFRHGFNQGWDRRDAHGVSRVQEIADLRATNKQLRALLKGANGHGGYQPEPSELKPAPPPIKP
jgi:hypothetical protein